MDELVKESEVQALSRCEKIIETGLHTFWEVGAALVEVRDNRLWQGQYENFTEYLANRWKLKPAYAGHLMLAAGIRAELNAHSTERRRTLPVDMKMADEDDGKPPFDLPDSVAAACALRSLETEQKVEVLERLHDKNLPVTRQNIKNEIAEFCPPPERIPKLSYGVLRNSIDALVKQSAFLDSVAPEKLDQFFATPDDREFAIEALTKLVELLSKE